MIELASVPFFGKFLSPDDRVATNLIDYELGGVGTFDSSEGNDYQVWVGTSDGTSIWVAPESDLSNKTLVTSGVNIVDITITFDQAMRPAVAFIDDVGTQLYWYDSTVQGFTTTVFPGVKSPKLTLDLKNIEASSSGLNDIHFFYIKNGAVYYRIQRDRYGVEYALGGGEAHHISRLGMCADWRLRIEVFFRAEQ